MAIAKISFWPLQCSQYNHLVNADGVFWSSLENCHSVFR